MIDFALHQLSDIVYKINNEIYEQTEGTEYFSVNITTDGHEIFVEFLDILIWSSIDEFRNFNEEKNQYESIEKYLRKQINNEIKKLSAIKL